MKTSEGGSVINVLGVSIWNSTVIYYKLFGRKSISHQSSLLWFRPNFNY